MKRLIYVAEKTNVTKKGKQKFQKFVIFNNSS